MGKPSSSTLPSSSSSSSSFSYSKLTLLQVHGAQERSRQSIELTQSKNRLALAVSAWKSHTLRHDEEDNHHHHHHHHRQPFTSQSSQIPMSTPAIPTPIKTTTTTTTIHPIHSQRRQQLNRHQQIILEESIQSAFSHRELSIIMVERLVNLCRIEYRAEIILSRAMERFQKDCEMEMNYWTDRVQVEETERLQSITDLQKQIKRIQYEMESFRLRQMIITLRQRLESERRKQTTTTTDATPVNPEEGIEMGHSCGIGSEDLVERGNDDDDDDDDVDYPDDTEFEEVNEKELTESMDDSSSSSSSSCCFSPVYVVEEPFEDSTMLPLVLQPSISSPYDDEPHHHHHGRRRSSFKGGSNNSRTNIDPSSSSNSCIEWVDLDEGHFHPTTTTTTTTATTTTTTATDETSDWVICL